MVHLTVITEIAVCCAHTQRGILEPYRMLYVVAMGGTGCLGRSRTRRSGHPCSWDSSMLTFVTKQRLLFKAHRKPIKGGDTKLCGPMVS